MRVRRTLPWALALALAASGLAAAAPLVTPRQSAPPDDVAQMIEAERAFCKKAALTSIRDAFYEYLAPGAILFRPGPIDGKAYYLDRPSNPGPILNWSPSYAEMAASGDLGWTTGPWDYRSAADKPVEAWGHFATVWQKQPRGDWKAIIDDGHSSAKPPDESLTWARIGGKDEPDPELIQLAALSQAHQRLLDTDRAYSEALTQKGVAAALSEFGDVDVRILRDDQPTYQGVAAAGSALAHEWDRGARAWDMKAGAISKTGDLAFTYGVVDLPPGKKTDPPGRNVFRVWRRIAQGPWKLALDVTNPMPVPAKPVVPRRVKPPKRSPSH